MLSIAGVPLLYYLRFSQHRLAPKRLSLQAPTGKNYRDRRISVPVPSRVAIISHTDAPILGQPHLLQVCSHLTNGQARRLS
jgi:hypothetical protein